MITFKRKDYPTIMSGKVVRYTADNGSLEINASREGIGIQGGFTTGDFDAYLRILQVTKIAWQQHRNLIETGDVGPTDKVDFVDESNIHTVFGVD